MSAVSSSFWSALLHALREERPFVLVEQVPYPNKCRIQPRLARNQFQVRNSVRPIHLFGRTLRSWLLLQTPPWRGAGRPIITAV